MSQRPNILLAAVGGTISAAPGEEGGERPALGAEDLLTTVPQAAAIADIVPINVERISSRAMTPSHMCSLAHRIRSGIEEGCDGVVITHGTDTIEETAYALALQLERQVPIVLTGAMRPARAAGTDGPANLMAALRVAATPEGGALGPVVVIHDEIHLARWVTKVHTSRVSAFASPTFGPVGHLVEGKVRLQAYRPAEDYIGLPEQLDARVELVWVAAGADGLPIESAAIVADGVVVAGTGGGHVPPAMVGSLQAAIERGVQIVLASRCVSGPVLEETYGGIGSEIHLRKIGLVPAGELSPTKARLRLLTALALGRDVTEVLPV